MHLIGALILTVITLAQKQIADASPHSGWNDAPNTQYHIQTDEGPERFFRYQTLNGQYRKEKRLEDGTVIGTNGWVDPNGYLRLQDYIADSAGYRILKSKMIFVGNERGLNDGLAVSKHVPATSGELVSPARIPTEHFGFSTTSPPPRPPYVRVSPNSIETNTKAVPFVEISPNGIESSTVSPYGPSSTVSPVTIGYLPPSSSYLPPISSTTVAPPTSTLLPPSSTYLPSVSSSYLPPSSSFLPPSTTVAPSSTYFPSRGYYSYRNRFRVPSSTATPIDPISSNSVSYSPPEYQYRRRKPYRPNYYETSTRIPIDRTEALDYNKIGGDDYSSQSPEYDGVSVTRNGFRYYLPRQYHEEENLSGERRTGSFGYIDPFGIRRVVYYNSGPGTGFVHRKNNRYVGFNATPYDPRPY